MHLNGHADIHTTMLYVQLAPEDVWCEFARPCNSCRLSLRRIVMKRSQLTMDEILEAQIQVLATPGGLKTVRATLLCP